MKRPLFALGFLGIAIGCSDAPPSNEVVGSTKSPIIGGRPSGDDENAAVFIVTQNDAEGVFLRCSGRIIAPGLVLSARHCFLKRQAESVRCTADGNPVDVTDMTTIETEPSNTTTVFIGSDKANMRSVAVKETLTNADVTLCRSDIAYLVLAEPGLDTRTAVRRALPAIGETISITGWGYVDDTQREKLPERRSTIAPTISDIGPGAIPDGTFAINGGTVCLGDSGANALADGATIGVYTRIDGDPNNCTNPLGRNVLTSVMSEPELLAKAYAAIGEEPWFAGEEKPWLAAAGSACAKDDDCRSGVCDGAACRAGCGPAKLGCKIGEVCSADGQSCVAGTPALDAGASGTNPAPGPRLEDSSCRSAPPRGDGKGALALVLAVVAIGRRRRRMTTT